MKRLIRRITAAACSLLLLLGITVICSTAAHTYILGDLNEDGSVTSADARMALRYAVDLEYYTKGHLIIGDMNSDGKLSAQDARTLIRVAVGLEIPDGIFADVKDEDFNIIINAPSEGDLFEWVLPDMPEVNAPSETFTFTVYGYGHGVGLSQYGSMTLDEAGYSYKEILSHYYSGTEVVKMENIPVTTVYPTLEYVEELGREAFVYKEHPTEELLARIVYQELYGATKQGKYKESLKALTLCAFSNLAYYNFDIESRWDVGIASPLTYEELPESLRELVSGVFGEYITVKGENKPIMAVFSGLAAGYTASSEDIWGGRLSYLTAVPSPFDMKHKDFISEYTYTKEEMRQLIMNYDSSIVLSDDPGEWLEIVEHTASMDANRGYVEKIRVGNKILRGYNQFHMGLMGNTFRSTCFVITYTP